MSLVPVTTDNFIVQSSHPLPEVVFTVCGMSVYKNDRLPWIVQALDSVINQTFAVDLFVVVIDGFVDDSVSDYLSRTERLYSNLVIVHGLENSGLSACMNFVIDFTLPLKPSYFFRMDADDVSVLHRVEKQVALLEKHQDVDVLGSALWEIDEKGNRAGIRRLPLKHTELIASFSRRCPINHPTVAIRYKVFEQGYRYRDDMLNTQDYFLWIALAHAGYKFANVREPLLNFRRINGFYKRRGRGKSVNEFRARMLAMKQLEQWSVKNFAYACMVLTLRMMPAVVIKFAYNVDRFLLNLKRHH